MLLSNGLRRSISYSSCQIKAHIFFCQEISLNSPSTKIEYERVTEYRNNAKTIQIKQNINENQHRLDTIHNYVYFPKML